MAQCRVVAYHTLGLARPRIAKWEGRQNSIHLCAPHKDPMMAHTSLALLIIKPSKSSHTGEILLWTLLISQMSWLALRTTAGSLRILVELQPVSILTLGHTFQAILCFSLLLQSSWLMQLRRPHFPLLEAMSWCGMGRGKTGTWLLVIRRNQGSIHIKMALAGRVGFVCDVLASQQRVTVGHNIMNVYAVSEDFHLLHVQLLQIMR